MDQNFFLQQTQTLLNQAELWVREELFTLGTWVQVLVVVFLFLAAFPVSALIRRLVLRILRDVFPEDTRLLQIEKKIARVAAPLMAAIFFGLAFYIAEKNHWSSQIILVARDLSWAWAVIRLLTSFLFSESWARVVAVFIWIVAALEVVKFLDPIIAVLDQISFTLDKQRISLWNIIKMSVTLMLVLPLAGKVAGFLENRLQKSEQLRPAVQLLLVKMVKIALFTLAIVIALDTTGIDFHLLLVFGGALGLGLGLGLQKVVSNLVSGFILLMDDSIRPGDVIEVEKVYGWIESLNARYVSMVTRDGTSYLIPNDLLMSNMVINWSHEGTGVRLKIPVGIAYGSDVRKAMELMLTVASTFPRVLQNPEPGTRLIRFGDSSIDLELRVWIKDPQNGIRNIRSEIQLGIWDAFLENNIAFPFRQHDLHLKGAPEVTVRIKERTDMEEYLQTAGGSKSQD